MTNSPTDSKGSLSEMARAARQAASRGERGERTTLNVQPPPAEQEGEEGPPPDALGQELVRLGRISRHQLFNALNESYHRQCSLREALLSLGYVTEEALSGVEG